MPRVERQGLCDCCLLYRHLDKNNLCFDCWNNPNCNHIISGTSMGRYEF
jgi:hypothetical protein